MNEVRSKQMLKKQSIILGGQQVQTQEQARANANVNEQIQQKVDEMIETKRQPEKRFNNNPPRKEVPGPNPMAQQNLNGKNSKTIGDESQEYLTGANNLLGGMSVTDALKNANVYNSTENLMTIHEMPSMQHNGSSSNHKAYEAQFMNYQIKKMYNNEAVTQFGSAETKLKQLHLKLREAENAQARMKYESAALKKNLSQLQSVVPEELADNLCNLLLQIATDSYESMEEHEKLREKYNLTRIQSQDQQKRVHKNMQKAFDLLRKGDEFSHFVTQRTLKKNELLENKQVEIVADYDDEEENDEMDEAEKEELRKQSMCGLIMGFSYPTEEERQQRKKGNAGKSAQVAEDSNSMNDMMSDLDDMPGSPDKNSTKQAGLDGGMGMLNLLKVGFSETVDQKMADGRHQKGQLSIDTDTILRNANDNLNSSYTDDSQNYRTAHAAPNLNKIPLPNPLPANLAINNDYLAKYQSKTNFQVFRVTTDFHPLEKRHFAVKAGDLVSGFSEEAGWIGAFKDTNPNKFGFIPKNYLTLDHQTNSKSVTPTSQINQPANNQSMTSSKIRHEEVKGFLGDVYSDVARE